MNAIDKAIAFINPEKALRRYAARRTLKILNTGYSQSGASRTKKSMRGWDASSSSPQSDIDLNLDILRQRSRDLFMSGGLGRSAIVTPRTNVVGAGLKLKSRIDYEFLGISKEQADEWEKNTEREFLLWSESVHCDALKLNNFYEMQSILFMSTLLNGDGWAAIKQLAPEPYFPYGLKIHLFEGDRVNTPDDCSNGIFPNKVIGKNDKTGNKIINGIEIDDSGEIVAYWICNQYSKDITKLGERKEWIRVKAFGSLTGMPNILQVMEAERCEQYRGVPYLAPILEHMKQITRYTKAELMAAIITAFFTVFIKESADMPIGGFPLPEAVSEKVDLDPNAFELGAGTINTLPPGYDVTTADPNRPSTNFETFVAAVSKQIGAALEIPYEMLLKNFTASYSASRAALLEAWKMFKMRRIWFANDFCQPVYEAWLTEAIARGRIKAPGFFNDPLIAKAYSRAEWYGPAQGQLDPVKEVKAAELRVKNGFSTREGETIELTGGDFDRNIEQLERENELMKKSVSKPKEGGSNIE